VKAVIPVRTDRRFCEFKGCPFTFPSAQGRDSHVDNGGLEASDSISDSGESFVAITLAVRSGFAGKRIRARSFHWLAGYLGCQDKDGRAGCSPLGSTSQVHKGGRRGEAHLTRMMVFQQALRFFPWC